MRSELVPSFLARADELLATGRFQNFLAQSHSRDVLRYLGTPQTDWPEYTATLDEDLVYTAQYLLYIGINLKTSPESEARGDECLTLGAEIFEHVYASSDSTADPERVTQVFSAALAYYVAGHFARAYVLVRDLEATGGLPRFVRPLRHLLLKEFGLLRANVLERLLDTTYSDSSISARLSSGNLDESGAFGLVFEATLYRALSHLLEHFKSGVPSLLDAAEAMLDEAIELAIEQRFADWWWYCSCVRILLVTYRRHNLWQNLQPLLLKVSSEPIAELYIGANLRLATPVVELWPSQLTAIPYLFDRTAHKNLCLRMPTSAGKTKIAELAILAFLSDFEEDPDAKCVYVAPFRALAVEIEQTLKKVFLPLGIRVSELYGGFELTLADKVLIEKTHILVATPEKLDALFRFSPDLVAKIKLVVLDEGHIVSEPNFAEIRKSRGLKYEVFLQRLVRRFDTTETRILFLSAVMPNAEQFAEWITGDRSGLVASNWRPSRLMLGEAVWDGQMVSIEYTHANHKPLGHRCFVKRFVVQTPADLLGDRRRHAPFPRDYTEALALTALEFATRGMTMVFVARKASCEPFGRTVLACIKLRHRLAEASGTAFSLRIDPRHATEVARGARIIREHMGEDSEIAAFLEAGFIVHHGSLPQAVRITLERLVRSGAVCLVIATTTLAQGVNFPIHTVLVHSLDHGHNDLVSPMDFWNICGRAGRGMKENEGQVLFFVPKSYKEWEKGKSRQFRTCREGWKRQKWQEDCEEKAKLRASYINAYGNYAVNSALLSLVNRVATLWKESHGNVKVSELCEALANHRLELFAKSEDTDLESVLSTLDGLLLSLTEESDADEITPDTFDSLLHRSLLFLQLESEAQRRAVSRIFAARHQYICGRHPNPTKRRQFYQLGLPLKDCEKVDELRARLLALYLEASEYYSWNAERRAQLLADIAEVLFHLDEIRPSSDSPDCWRRVLYLWLCGQTPTDIAKDAAVAACQFDARGVSHWIDDICGYRLPWGYNILGIYLGQIAEETECDIPSACQYFSSFVKYGVHEPVACWLLTFGVQSRAAAVRSADYMGSDFAEPKQLLNWLQSGGLEHLQSSGLDDESLEAITLMVNSFSEGNRRRSRSSVSLRLALPQFTTGLTPGTRLVLRSTVRNGRPWLHVHLLNGARVASYSDGLPSEDLWELLERPELVNAVVSDVEEGENHDVASVMVQAV